MSSEKYILFSLNDDKSKKLGEAISNPTCKKIVALLSEKELSEEDLSKELKIPMNTIEYNLKKLLHSGLIEKSKNFFWSKKGKKISTYKIANKLIVISPKNSFKISSTLKEILPVALISGILTLLVFCYFNFREVSRDVLLKVATAPEVAESAYNQIQIPLYSSSGNWVWFLLGWFIFVILFLFWSWRKSR